MEIQDQLQQSTSSDQDEESIRRRTELFHTYVLPHLNMVYKLCIRYTYSQADIEDNYNEVLINFFKYIDTYDPSRSIQTWLHIVTKRFVGDMNLKNSSFKRSEDVSVSEIIDAILDEGGISGNGFRIEDYQTYYNDDILNALSELKPIYREALLLQQAGYKLTEIMEISYKNGNMKVKNIDTVKSRLFLAKKQLREIITKDGNAKRGT